MPSLLKKIPLSPLARKTVIIRRYLLKEVFAALLGVTFILMLIFLSNQLVRYLGYAASGKIGAPLVLQLLGFEIPYLLALLLPLGLYLGVILAIGRLYVDSEMPVMHACGLDMKTVSKMLAILASVVFICVFILTMWVNPMIAQQKYRGIAQSNMLDSVRPGRFQVLNEGRRVVYTEKISRDRKQAHNLFIAEEATNTAGLSKWVVVAADNGHQEKDPATKNKFIVANDGYRYEGTPGNSAYKVIAFQKYAVKLPTGEITNQREDQETLPTKKLIEEYSNPARASELQWRISIPLSVFVLMLIAIPLSKIRPRQGRYSHLFPAILLYVVYVNLLFLSRNWMEIKLIPISLGVWWVHGVMLSVGLFLFMLQHGVHLTFPTFKFAKKTS